MIQWIKDAAFNILSCWSTYGILQENLSLGAYFVYPISHQIMELTLSKIKSLQYRTSQINYISASPHPRIKTNYNIPPMIILMQYPLKMYSI